PVHPFWKRRKTLLQKLLRRLPAENGLVEVTPALEPPAKLVEVGEASVVARNSSRERIELRTASLDHVDGAGGRVVSLVPLGLDVSLEAVGGMDEALEVPRVLPEVMPEPSQSGVLARSERCAEPASELGDIAEVIVEQVKPPIGRHVRQHLCRHRSSSPLIAQP